MASKLVSCSICSKPFDSKECVPKILQCLHVGCCSCIERMAKDGNFNCSRCKENTKIGPNGGSGLLTDPTRLRLRLLADISEQTGSIPCHDCPDSANALYFCQNCNEFHCKECRDLHLNKRSRFSRDHTVIALSEVTPEILQSSKKPEMCPDHDQPLIFFCNKAECNVAVCIACTVSKHKEVAGHDICNVTDAFQRNKEDIEHQANETRKELKTVEAAKKREETNQNHIEKLKTKVIAEIDDEFQYISKLIKAKRDALVKDVEKKHMIMKESSTKQVLEMELSCEKITAALTFENNVRAFCSETEYIKLKETIQKRFETLNKTKASQRPVNGYNMQYKQKVPNEFLKALSNNSECIESQTLRLDASEVGTSKAIQNSRCEIAKIVLKNQQGVTQLVNTENVEATVTDSKGKTSKCEVKQNATHRSMDVYLRAATSGHCGLQINILGQPLKGGEDLSIIIEKEQDSEYEIASEALAESIIAGSQFTIDKETVHESLRISDDGKTLSYGGWMWRKLRGSRQMRTWKGGRGTMCFDKNTTGKVYYQVRVGGCPCEIGLCRQENIDKYNTVKKHPHHQHPHSVSLFVDGCRQHWGLSCTVWKSGKRLFYNEVSLPFMFGFLLDSQARTFSVVDCKDNKVMAVVNDVNLDQPLWPVFSVSCSAYLTLMSGTDIARIPKCL